MHLGRRLSFQWWLIGALAVAAVAATAFYFFREREPYLPPGFAEKRDEAAKILEQAGRIEDIDTKPLVDLEARKDYRGAVALMDEALKINAEQIKLNASLISAAEELAKLSFSVEPDGTGAKAVEAFDILSQLASTEEKFLAGRKFLYETARNYYADLLARKKPAVPDSMKALVETVNADFAKVQDLYRRFTNAAKTFDAALRAKK